MKFDPTKKKWIIEIKDSIDAEVSLEEKNVIFKDETVKKVISSAAEVIFEKTAAVYIDVVMPEIESGSFLQVDEAKAEALKDFLEDRELKTAFEKKTFVK